MAMPSGSRRWQYCTSLQVVDPAVTITAPTGALVPSAAPLLGTTIIVYNNPTIYVVGASGLNGFATHGPVPG